MVNTERYPFLSGNPALGEASFRPYLLLAFYAIRRNATPCTFNVKHYQGIPGLGIEQPFNQQG